MQKLELLIVKEEDVVNKVLYNIEFKLIKIVPYLIMGCYLLNTILSYFDVESRILSLIGGMSILPWLFLLVSSFVFKFCVYHRLPLYYVLISDTLNYYDYCIGFNVINRTFLFIHLVIAGITIFLIVFLKFKLCKKN